MEVVHLEYIKKPKTKKIKVKIIDEIILPKFIQGPILIGLRI